MKKLGVFSFFVAAGLVAYFAGCTAGSGKSNRGTELAKQYCSSCHQFPQPDWLDKTTWSKYVLPKMSGMLGFLHMDEYGGYVGSGKEVMSIEDWNKILDYYTSQAPDRLEKKSSQKISGGLKRFAAYIPSFTRTSPATTMVAIDPSGPKLFIGDGAHQQLFMLNAAQSPPDSIAIGKGISNLRISDQGLTVMTMGVLYPSDTREGRLVQFDSGQQERVLIDSLRRPVHAAYADLDGDNREDIIICEFGNTTGQLAWFRNKEHDTYERHVLRALPGAVKTEIQDFNKDGRPDILALMAQGDEGFFIFYNQGAGRFKAERILQFPPSYGSNYFELYDFNGDGHKDIIATNGDNGDYPPVLKPYHGIRIYMNDGKHHFTEKLFLPVNGASKAIATDFDRDGDPDIASIAYFPDYEHSPEEGFIYWENKGGLRFDAFSCKEANMGRWLTMDKGDLDADGDLDIILGNTPFSLGQIPVSLKEKWTAYSPSVLILENTLLRPPKNKKTRY